jgi:hypothetical protein
MNRRDGLYPILLVLAGMFGLSVFVRPPSSPADSQRETRASAATPAVALVRQSEGADWLRNALPALRLVADHLGVSEDAECLAAPRPTVNRTLGCLREIESALASRPLDLDLGGKVRQQCVSQLSATGPFVSSCDSDCVLARAAGTVAREAVSLKATEKDDAWDRLAGRAEGDASVARLLCRSKAAARARNLDLRFVIATVPDYVDGNAAWDTDQRFEALQRAAAAAGFASDRFYLPGWVADRPASDAAAVSKEHEVQPGALLFRRYESATSRQLLVVLFAPETATLGVHGDALLSAMALASAWGDSSTLRLIAPSFSGSSVSLRATIDKAFQAGLLARGGGEAPRLVRILSGSATGIGNLKALMPGDGRPGPKVTFNAMTLSDDDSLCAVQDYLSSTHGPWTAGRRMAILRESNTAYGSSLSRWEEGQGEGAVEEAIAVCAGKFPKAYVFPFPLYISRLRAQATTAQPSVPAAPSASHVHLKLDEASPKDRLPAVAPELTAAMAETALDNILDSLERLGISAVGLYATDKRDHLFLAQEISRRVPSVQLFALEGNLVYLHPDYRSYVRGTLVVGSYPLFFLAQPNRPDSQQFQQFPSMAAEGVYNALLAQLWTRDDGTHEDALLQSMLDYDDCDSRGCGPSAWIGVVGRDALWPVRRVSRGELAQRRKARAEQLDRDDRPGDAEVALAGLGYAWVKPLPADVSERLRGDRFRLPLSAALAGLLVCLALGYLSAPAIVRRALTPRLRLPRPPVVNAGRALDMMYAPGARLPWRSEAATPCGAQLATLRREHLVGRLSCVAPALLAGLWLAAALLATYVSVKPLVWSATRVLVCTTVAALTVIALVALRPVRGQTLPFFLRRAAVSAVVVLTLALFAAAVPGPRLTGELSALNGLRYLTLSSLVSPTVPVLCLASGVMAWGLWRLRQTQLQSAALDPDSPVAALIWGDHPAGHRGVVQELNDPRLPVGGWGLGLVALATGAEAVVGVAYRHTGEGSVWLGLFLWSAAILMTVLVGFTLAHSLRLGGTLVAGLHALERHPLRLAFGNLNRLGLSWKLSLSAPRSDILAPIVRQAGALARALREEARKLAAGAEPPPQPVQAQVARRQRATDASDAPDAPDAPDAAHVDPALQGLSQVMCIRSTDVVALAATDVLDDLGRNAAELRSGVLFHASFIWARLEALSLPLVRSLQRGPWSDCPYPDTSATAAPSRPRCHAEAETLLALQVACVLRLLLARLLSGFTVVVAGLVLLLGAHLFYSFQGRPFWLGFDAFLVCAATALILKTLVGLEKDPVLSRLWGTRPGKIDWAGGFSLRMAAYATIAVLTVFASFFPEVGSAILQWVEPVKKAMP